MSFVKLHRDGHYFWKEIIFLHQKAGVIWCQFKDSFKKWIKYIYIERTLYCPISPHLILLVTDKSLITDCPQIVGPMALSQNEVYSLQTHGILFYPFCGT